MSIITTIIPIITALGGYSVKGVIDNKKNKRIMANQMYEKIRDKMGTFENSIAQLVSLAKDSKHDEVLRKFLEAVQAYEALYNEIEDFCTQIFDKVINSEKYLKNTVAPSLSELAEKQVEYYEVLNKYANKYNLEKIRRHDYKAFEKYDKFLIHYNGGENSHFWKKLKNTRRDADFE